MKTITRPLAALALVATAAAGALLPGQAHAAQTLTVCASGCDYTTVKAAASGASADDTIEVGAGTYTGVVVINKDLTIEAMAGARPVLTSGAKNNALRVKPGKSATLRGLEFSGSTKYSAIKNEGTLVLDDVYVVANQTVYGGVWNMGDLTIIGNSVFSGNEATTFLAAALNNIGGTVVIDQTTFLMNSGYNGGAVANLQGDMTISHTSFTGNDGYLGGAIHNSFGDLEVIDSSFSTNHADSLGGAWSNHNLGGTVTTSGIGYAANTTGSGSYEDCYDVNGGCQP